MSPGSLLEECDDANTVDTDACLSSCILNVCGDGVQLVGVEACDDGNSDNTDGCTNACRLPACGDGFLQAGESCDDGDTVDEGFCNATCGFRCDTFRIPGYSSAALFDGRCYLFRLGGETYAAATARCTALPGLVGGSGTATLASIATVGEDDHVREMANAGGSPTVWFGLDDIATEGALVWQDGSTLGYTDWSAGQPDNGGGNEDCIMMSSDRADSDYGQWRDVSCAAPRAAVCEYTWP